MLRDKGMVAIQLPYFTLKGEGSNPAGVSNCLDSFSTSTKVPLELNPVSNCHLTVCVPGRARAGFFLSLRGPELDAQFAMSN